MQREMKWIFAVCSVTLDVNVKEARSGYSSVLTGSGDNIKEVGVLCTSEGSEALNSHELWETTCCAFCDRTLTLNRHFATKKPFSPSNY